MARNSPEPNNAQQVRPRDDAVSSAINAGLINWPTVLASAGAAAIVAAIILSIGIVGLSRGGTSPDQQPTIVVNSGEESKESAASSSNRSDKPSASTTTKPSASASAQAAAPEQGSRSDDSARVAGQPAPAAPAGQVAPDEPEPAEPASEQDNASSQTAVSDSPEIITSNNPSAVELGRIVSFLTATDAPDEAKARLIESADAVIVPQTISRVGFFRSPKGGSQINGPVQVQGNRATAHLEAHSAGIPNVSMPIIFVKKDGNWRLSAESLCSGVKTIGLPIYCNS